MAPATGQALVMRGGKFNQEQIPVPTPGEHQLLVKVSHTAQNPTDVVAHSGDIYGDGAVLSCDFTGIVEAVGSGVTRFKPGDAVTSIIWGGKEPGLGALSEYTLASEEMAFKTPSNISPAQAATIPLACATSWLGFFSKDNLAIDRSIAKQDLLIWGGSSSVGLYAVQIGALFDFNVVATASPKHHDAIRSLGAKHVFDYNDPDVVFKIKAAAPNLKRVWDTIGKSESSTIASQAIHESGGTLCTVRPGKQFTDNVSPQTTVKGMVLWTMFNKEINFRGTIFPARQGDHDLAVEFFENIPEYIADGSIVPNEVKLYENGFEDVEKGYQEHRDGLISKYKIVCKL